MARERRTKPPTDRSTVALPRSTLLRDLPPHGQDVSNDDPARIVNKTYKLPAGVIAAVKDLAATNNVGIGELVTWMLSEGIKDLTEGRRQLPVHTAHIEVPVLGERRGRPPAMRRIAKGTVHYTAPDVDA